MRKLALIAFVLGFANVSSAQEFVTVEYTDGTVEHYAVLSVVKGKTIQSTKMGSPTGRKDEYTVLRVGPDRKTPSFTVAKESKLTVYFANAVPDSITGALPESEKVVALNLAQQFHTEILRPDGTILPYMCAFNDTAKGGDSSVSSVCLSTNIN